MKAHLHGPKPALHVGRDLALKPDGKKRKDVDEPEDKQADDEQHGSDQQPPGHKQRDPHCIADLPDPGLEVNAALLRDRPMLPGDLLDGGPGHGSEQRAREELEAHRSTSPITMSRLPMIATMSATMQSPLDVKASRTLILENEGPRALTRYGLVVPSLTR